MPKNIENSPNKSPGKNYFNSSENNYQNQPQNNSNKKPSISYLQNELHEIPENIKDNCPLENSNAVYDNPLQNFRDPSLNPDDFYHELNRLSSPEKYKASEVQRAINNYYLNQND